MHLKSTALLPTGAGFTLFGSSLGERFGEISDASCRVTLPALPVRAFGLLSTSATRVS